MNSFTINTSFVIKVFNQIICNYGGVEYYGESKIEGDGEEAWLTVTARGGVRVWRELRERAEGSARLRESSVTAMGVGGT